MEALDQIPMMDLVAGLALVFLAVSALQRLAHPKRSDQQIIEDRERAARAKAIDAVNRDIERKRKEGVRDAYRYAELRWWD